MINHKIHYCCIFGGCCHAHKFPTIIFCLRFGPKTIGRAYTQILRVPCGIGVFQHTLRQEVKNREGREEERLNQNKSHIEIQ